MVVSDPARAAGAEVRLRGAVDVDAGHRLAPRRPPRRPAHRQEARYVPGRSAHRQEARYVPAAASPARPPQDAPPIRRDIHVHFCCMRVFVWRASVSSAVEFLNFENCLCMRF